MSPTIATEGCGRAARRRRGRSQINGLVRAGWRRSGRDRTGHTRAPAVGPTRRRPPSVLSTDDSRRSDGPTARLLRLTAKTRRLRRRRRRTRGVRYSICARNHRQRYRRRRRCDDRPHTGVQRASDIRQPMPAQLAHNRCRTDLILTHRRGGRPARCLSHYLCFHFAAVPYYGQSTL